MKNYLNNGNQFVDEEKLLFDRLLLAVFAQGQHFYYTSVEPFTRSYDLEWDLFRKGLLYRVGTKRDEVTIHGWLPTWIECQADGLSDTLGVSAECEDWQIRFEEDYWTGRLHCMITGDQAAANKWVETILASGTSIYQAYDEDDCFRDSIYADFVALKKSIKYRRVIQMMEAATEWTVLQTRLVEGKVKLSRTVKAMIKRATFHETGGHYSFYTYDEEPTDSYMWCSEGFSIYSTDDYMLVFRDIERVDYRPDRQQLIGFFKNSSDAVAFRFANT